MTSTKTRAAEWRSYPMLPVAAALGYSTSVIHIYGLGPYIEPLQAEFGWSRAQITAGLTIATFVDALFCVPIGAPFLWLTVVSTAGSALALVTLPHPPKDFALRQKTRRYETIATEKTA